jgi:hypothetical protein
MGGPLPLGYDVKNRLLMFNEVEAAIVRRVFEEFVQERSTTTMIRKLTADGLLTNTGRRFCKQTIYKILHNRMYLGEILHKGKGYPVQHQPIITHAQWDAVHALLAQDSDERRALTVQRGRPLPLLRGLLFAADADLYDQERKDLPLLRRQS